MIDFIIAIDLEAKYLRWIGTSRAARRLNAVDPVATCEVFTQLYRAFPSDLLREYDITASERSVA